MIDVYLPGTGGMIPQKNRWLSCCWIEHQGQAILIDCGEGTQIALKECGCKISRLNMLLITHFHADHIAGLPGLLLTLGNNGKTTPLIIVGPVGLKKVFDALTVIAPVIPYPIETIEIRNDEIEKLKMGEMEISYVSLKHSIDCYGYSITLRRKPRFNPEKAHKLCIPEQYFKRLHAGNIVQLDDGRVVTPKMVLDGERDPIKVCYCTDTRPIDAMIEFAKGADLLICEGMYGKMCMQNKLEEKGHMLFSESARVAEKACVKELWLTHYSPALIKPQDYSDSVKKIFKNSVVAYDGIHLTLPNNEKTDK
ncbi:ribonuclease Z [Anaerovorax sp. IOR16]|uniref:ribonuclease Z n=1 Tax=Anaerovorax sp. IOR16 TaxID=2773458 RepID=UPI0019D2C4DA|nr:ribonuclease Z [Anaerovorax sp. IOR16]